MTDQDAPIPPEQAMVNARVEPRPDYRTAWQELHGKLEWIQFHPLLTRYLGMNFADVANALIDEAYPGLRDRTATTLETLWPDIGTDPLKGERPVDRYEASAIAVRAAYVRQQQGVPPQTALVWRWHLGALLEEHTRLHAIMSRREHDHFLHPENVDEVVACIDLVRRMAGNSSLGRPFAEDQMIQFSSQHYDDARLIVEMSVGNPYQILAVERHGKALFDHEMKARGLTADWNDVDPDEQLGWIASAQAVLSAS